MKNKNMIGLDNALSADLAEKLNNLLANFQLFYQNLRGVHWNIRGTHFFTLHPKFEELYTDAQLKIDEVAERILTLGQTPLHTFTDYLAQGSIKEGKHVVKADEAVQLVIDGLKALLVIEREAFALASDLGDEGTTDMLSTFISGQEKNVWMLTAWLGK